MYRHFGCKNNLIAQVLQNRHMRMQQQLILALEAEQGVANKLDALIDWHFNWFEQAVTLNAVCFGRI